MGEPAHGSITSYGKQEADHAPEHFSLVYGQNWSAPGNVVTVTTAAVSATDTQAPSSPRDPHGWDAGDGAREIHLFWTESFDRQTAQAFIAYDVYPNGALDHTPSGGRAIL